MTVKELIRRLKKMSQDAPVIVMISNDDGCGTYGYGASIDEREIDGVYTFDTRVVLNQ